MNKINKLFFSRIFINYNCSVLSQIICGIFKITLLSVIESVVVALDVLTVEKCILQLVLVKINSVHEFMKIVLKSLKNRNQYFKVIQVIKCP